MTALVEEALALWGLEGAANEFIAGRENQVFRVRGDQGDFALRIKRPGYRDAAELRSELLWLEAMHSAGLSVPLPQPANDGRMLVEVGDHVVDMLSWLSGPSLAQLQPTLTDAELAQAVQQMGAEMAKLHLACDVWSVPPGFVRCAWDVDGLLGETPVWGRFWENPTLDTDTRDLFERFRQAARDELLTNVEALDYGLIHADLLQENVLIDGATVRLIDFDDGGFGFRLFDLATTILRLSNAPNFDALREALIAGYRAHREIDTRHLNLFYALRAMTYVGWIVPRMSEDGSEGRNQRFVARAQDYAAEYLRG